MQTAEFLNHIKRTLDRCMQRWEFLSVGSSNLKPVEYTSVRFLGSGDAVGVWHNGVEYRTRDISGDYAERLKNLLNGMVRDDAGNMVAR